MDRLSTLDAEFLNIEDGVAHMHIAGLSVFAGPQPSREDIEALLAGKLHRIPRYRQRVRTVPLELGRPVWLDDPHFSLRYHVRHTALPQPADQDTLCRLMGRLMSQPLDRNRPLWESWIVEGLPDGQWALITKVHHCMVDGISGVDLLAVMLDDDPTAEVPEPEPWEPAPEPAGAARVLDAWAGLAGDLAGLAREVPDLVRHPIGAARRAGELGSGLLRLASRLGTTPPLSIEGSIGPHRSWACSSATIDDIRRVRKAFGGTLNDVVLAAVARGYRDLLLSRGDELDDVVFRTLVPVSVRTADARGVLDNRVSALVLELPVDVGDPVERLDAVRARMEELKSSHIAEAGETLAELSDLAPPMLVGATVRLSTRMMRRTPQRSVNTVTTNVPGPQYPLYCLGREMTAYYPFVPILHGVRVGTAILSYNGRITFGVTGDYDSVPDVGILADGIADGIAELCAVAS